MQVPSWRLRAAVLAMAVVATTSCGSDAGDGDLRQNEQTGSPATTAVDSTATTTTTGESPDHRRGADTVGGDRPRRGRGGGAQRERVRPGEPVVLVVDADVADEVHVHGYDHMAPVAPGAPAELQFTPDIPGVFEVELEDRGVVLVRLEVA